MGYGGTVPHGLTKYLLMVLPRLVASGHRVTAVFLREEHASGAALVAAGVRTVFLDAGRYDPMLVPRLSRLVRRLQPDVVHATQVQSILLARLLAALGLRAPLVAHLHGLDRIPQPLRWVSRNLPQPHVALCVSRAAMGPGHSQLGIAQDRMRVFHNAFDATAFAAGASVAGRMAVRASADIPPDVPVVGLVGRFFPIKANDRLVRAMPEILRRIPEAYAVFAGDGELRPLCERLADDLGVRTRVRFLGHRDDVAQVTFACDVLVNTSPEDNFPYTALEAYAVGRPVVGFRAGGMPEMVREGETGFLAEPGDESGFARLIADCLADPSLREKLGSAGREFVRRFDIDRHVGDLVGIYTQITARGEAAP